MANKINFYQNFFPDWVVAGTTRKSFGNIKDPLNQVKLAEILKVPTSSLVSLTQKHTNFIYDASEASSQKIGDGLITDKKEIVIFVKTADCIPVLILEEKKKLIMVLHAGRVGLQKQIGEHGIKEILKRGGKVVNIKVLLGPFIEEKCYDFDLATLVKVQLHKNGVEDRQIVSTKTCTYCCNHEYFSYRRGNEERMATFIKMR